MTGRRFKTGKTSLTKHWLKPYSSRQLACRPFFRLISRPFLFLHSLKPSVVKLLLLKLCEKYFFQPGKNYLKLPNTINSTGIYGNHTESKSVFKIES